MVSLKSDQSLPFLSATDTQESDTVSQLYTALFKPSIEKKKTHTKRNATPKSSIYSNPSIDYKCPLLPKRPKPVEVTTEPEELQVEETEDEDSESYKRRKFQVVKKIKARYTQNVDLKNKNEILKNVLIKHHRTTSTPFVFIHSVTNQPAKHYFQKVLKWKASEDLRKMYPKRIKSMKRDYEHLIKPLRELFWERLGELQVKMIDFNEKSPVHDQRKTIRDRYIKQLITTLQDVVYSENALIEKKEEFKEIYEELTLTRNQIAENTGMTPDEYERLRIERYVRLENLAAMETPCDHGHEAKIPKPKARVCPKVMNATASKLCKRIMECRIKIAQLNEAIKTRESYLEYLKMQVDVYPKLNAKFDEMQNNDDKTICDLVESVNKLV